MKHASLFSGIGGFDLAAEWMGWDNIFHCEWNPFGQKVLKYHFPKSISYEDITKTDFSIHRGEIDILTGGFPCQPYSTAGKRLGKADERHLFPHMLRCIKEIKPKWVIGENVRGLVNWNGGMVFNEVYDDLEREGYEVQSFLIPAAGVNAPHQRYRIWFVAYSNMYGQQQEWRHDTSSKNADGCNNEKFRTADSKNFNGCNTHGNFEIQCGIDTRTCIKGIFEKNETANTAEFCGMDKNNRKSERSSHQNKFETNQSRTLVQDGQSWIQFSNNRGLGNFKDALSSTKGFGLHDDISRINRMERNVTNSDTSRVHEQHNSTESVKQEQFSRASFERRDFSRFPTQSAICGRNDGIPRELDSITFPKWRNESIKAYGNAIVPQVAHQIFKTIKEFEELV